MNDHRRIVGLLRRTLAVVCTIAAMAAGSTWASAGTGTEGAVCDGSVATVKWAGVRAFNADELGKACGLERGVVWTKGRRDSVARALGSIYGAEGYLNASFQFECRREAGALVVTVLVEESERARVGEVKFEGVTALTGDELLRLCPELKAGRPFSRRNLESAFERLVREYCSKGYANCRVAPRGFELDEGGSVDFTIAVEEGRVYYLEDFRVTGGRTRDATARAAAGVRPGVPFDPYELKRTIGRLAESGLFSSVGEPEVQAGSSDTTVVIEVPVKERPASSIGGILGYAGSKGGMVGLIDLRLGNILGTGRSGAFHWESSGSGATRYVASYAEPYVAGLPLGLEVGIEHLAQDSTYSTTTVRATGRYSVSGGLSLELGGLREKTAVIAAADSGAATRALTAVTVGVSWKGRQPVGARRSTALWGRVEWGRRRDRTAGGTSLWGVVRAQAGGELERPVAGPYAIYVGLRWRGLFAHESALTSDQLLRFGGATSLRGYREDQFRATRTALLQVEQRFFAGGDGSMFFAFTDVGFLGGRGVPHGALLGYGIGLRASAPGGFVGLEYGLGWGDSWSEGKVHVKLVRGF